jgi:hypothetical protein
MPDIRHHQEGNDLLNVLDTHIFLPKDIAFFAVMLKERGLMTVIFITVKG